MANKNRPKMAQVTVFFLVVVKYFTPGGGEGGVVTWPSGCMWDLYAKSYICHEMGLVSTSRPPDTTILTEISSRIHFWGLEGPEMSKIDLKQRFS